jgi:hypothetical protein
MGANIRMAEPISIKQPMIKRKKFILNKAVMGLSIL